MCDSIPTDSDSDTVYFKAHKFIEIIILLISNIILFNFDNASGDW